jgi:hypothetical protein
VKRRKGCWFVLTISVHIRTYPCLSVHIRTYPYISVHIRTHPYTSVHIRTKLIGLRFTTIVTFRMQKVDRFYFVVKISASKATMCFVNLTFLWRWLSSGCSLPCSLVEVYRRFKGTSCLHHQGDRLDDGGIKHKSSGTRMFIDFENSFHRRVCFHDRNCLC